MIPFYINLKDKKILVVGAGKIAYRRIVKLISEGAVVTVVSPEKESEKFSDLNINYIRSEYDKKYIDDFFMVLAATDSRNINERIIFDAKEKGILSSSVSGEGADFIFCFSDSKGSISFAVSTSGGSPALASALCKRISSYMEKYESLSEIQKNIRLELIKSISDKDRIIRIMRELSSPALLTLFRNYGKEKYIEQAKKIIAGDYSDEIDKKAILVVSFGTSYKETREKTIGAVEKKISEAFPEYDIYRAFTSEMIMKKMRRNGEKIMDISEALAYLYRHGYTEVICQPTHIIPGDEYDKMCRYCNSFNDCFKIFKTGAPLISSNDDFIKVLKSVSDIITTPEDTACIFMGHGTEHSSNSVYPALNYYFNKYGYKRAFVGTVEGKPDFDDVLEFLEKNNIKNIEMYPFMLVAGDHAINDMDGDENSWKNLLIKKGYHVKTHIIGLGENYKICEIYSEHLCSVINNEE